MTSFDDKTFFFLCLACFEFWLASIWPHWHLSIYLGFPWPPSSSSSSLWHAFDCSVSSSEMWNVMLWAASAVYCTYSTIHLCHAYYCATLKRNPCTYYGTYLCTHSLGSNNRINMDYNLFCHMQKWLRRALFALYNLNSYLYSATDITKLYSIICKLFFFIKCKPALFSPSIPNPAQMIKWLQTEPRGKNLCLCSTVGSWWKITVYASTVAQGKRWGERF